MWRRELLKNKLCAILFMGIGFMSRFVDGDDTFFIFSLLLGFAQFFSDQDLITKKEEFELDD